jgi:hypothetical protein
MSFKKTLGIVTLPLICAVFMFSQDLVELAKKEKERRARVQSKNHAVVTNRDLKRIRVRSGVTSRTTTASESDIPLTTTRSSQAKPGEEVEQDDPAIRVTVEQSTDQLEAPPEISLEEKWRRASNGVGTLNLKLTQLGQLFYGAETSDERARIQRQIDTTSRELEKAQLEVEKLRNELAVQEKK